MTQIVYYVVAAERLGGRRSPVAFAVPTGNFGNVFAGHVARRVGLNVPQLVVGTNTNDVLTQFFTEGTMAVAEVVPTTSPSMDIQISSNLERLLYEILDRDGAEVAARLDAFRSTGRFQLDPEHHAALSSTWSAACLLYTSPSPRDQRGSRMPSSA